MFDLSDHFFDLSDHSLTTISTWAEVAILLFMLWEKYGSALFGPAPMTTQSKGPRGAVRVLLDNRTLILAIVGLSIVAWLHLRDEQRQSSLTQVATTPQTINIALSKTTQHVRTYAYFDRLQDDSVIRIVFSLLNASVLTSSSIV